MESQTLPMWLLQYYREAEIRSADLLQRLLRYVDDPELQIDLTHQLADEARHIQLWTEIIETRGGCVTPVKKGYRNCLQRRAGNPTNILDLLALTHVVEERVQQRYHAHVSRIGDNSQVGETLRSLVGDESWHLAGVQRWLAKIEKQEGKTRVAALCDYYRLLEAKAYADLVSEVQQ